jgi:WD40 repeat protein
MQDDRVSRRTAEERLAAVSAEPGKTKCCMKKKVNAKKLRRKSTFIRSSSGHMLAMHETGEMAAAKEETTGAHKQVVMTSAKGVSSVCFHPDGRSVLVTNNEQTDKCASIWRMEAYSPASSLEDDEVRAARRLARSVSSVRRILIDERAAAHGPEVAFSGVHTSQISYVCFSADGRLAATCGRDNIAVVWNAKSGAPIVKVEGHTNSVRGVAFSADGKRLVTASFDKTAMIWSVHGDGAGDGHDWDGGISLGLEVAVPSGGAAKEGASDASDAPPMAKQLMILEGHSSDVYSADFSRDGTMVATASADGTAVVWDVSGAQPRERATLRGHLSIVRSAKFDATGERVITASVDGSAAVWCVATGQRFVVMIPPLVKLAGLHYAEFAPDDDDHCLTAGEDGLVRLWRVSKSRSSAFCVASLTGAKTETASVCTHAQFAPDGRTVVGSFADGHVYQWKAGVREERQRMLTGHTDRVWGAKLSPDGATLYSASSDQTVGVFDVASGVRLKTLDGVHTNSIRAISISRCGRYICTGCPDKKVGVWDAAEDYRLCAEFVHTHNIYAVAAAKDKAEWPRILFGSADNRANIVDVWAGEADEADGVHRDGIVVATFEAHTDCCAAVDWSECCTRIVTGGDDKQAFVFDVATESVVTALVGHTSYVLCCAFGSGTARDSEGKLVPSRCLTGSNDRTAVMWDAVTGAQLRVFEGHAHAIWGVAIAPGGKQIATSSQDATVALWSVDSDAKLLALNGHVGTIFDVDFSRDGETLISAGRDAMIGVWILSPPVHTSDVIAALRAEDDIDGTTTSFLMQVRLFFISFVCSILLFTHSNSLSAPELLAQQHVGDGRGGRRQRGALACGVLLQRVAARAALRGSRRCVVRRRGEATVLPARRRRGRHAA